MARLLRDRKDPEVFMSASRRRLNFVDCVGLEIMHALGVRSAFTFDPHFKEQGFKATMRMIRMIIPAFIVSLAFCLPSFAKDCTTNWDCDMYEHERCVIPPYTNVGTCLKSEHQGETGRETGSDTPASSPSKTGQFCMTNKDCDPGQSCVKKENALSGTCR